MDLRELLQPGVTGGINRVKSIVPDLLPHWRAGCHQVARALQARCGAEVPVGTARNFHSITIEAFRPARTFHILLHAVLPFVAVADRLAWNDNQYGDDAPIRGAFEPPFQTIPKALLVQRFDWEPWMAEMVDKSAAYDIGYWKPARIGDFVFNYYD